MIYEPKGKAREYSPLALNLYEGCGHGCVYCYVPATLKMNRTNFDSGSKPKKDVKDRLLKTCRKFAGTDKQVLMSFTTDPYNPQNNEHRLTRHALSMLYSHKIPVAILTKSESVIYDLDLILQFKQHIKVGMSLTFTHLHDSLKYEKYADTPQTRFTALKDLHFSGVRTWASLEPVIDPKQTLDIIDITYKFIDEYQVGKVNHVKSNVDWHTFLVHAVTKLRSYKKDFYVKSDLAQYAGSFKLLPHEIDMDHLTVKPFEKDNTLL